MLSLLVQLTKITQGEEKNIVTQFRAMGTQRPLFRINRKNIEV